MSDVLSSTLELIKRRKKNLESGGINGIPFAIEEFRHYLPVIEKGSYIVVTAQSKAAKSKFTNFCFVYHSIMYAYNHPEQLRVKIFYFPLEETPEEITIQFISFLLLKLSKRKIRVSPIQLKSSDANHLLSNEILELIQTPEYYDILKFYNSHVEFCEETNSVGIDMKLKDYARNNGQMIFKEREYTDFVTKEKKKGTELVEYIPNDPDEYVMAIIDHVSLLTPTREEGTLKNAIGCLSKNMVYIKNKLKYIPIVVQQQSAAETGGIEARKSNNIRPTKAGLSDNKSVGNDCTLMFGITNPWAFEKEEYFGYDLKELKDNFRMMEVVLNRNGQSNGLCPLFFDGATNYFKRMPNANDAINIRKVYNYIHETIRPKAETKDYAFLSFSPKKKKYKRYKR